MCTNTELPITTQLNDEPDFPCDSELAQELKLMPAHKGGFLFLGFCF